MLANEVAFKKANTINFKEVLVKWATERGTNGWLLFGTTECRVIDSDPFRKGDGGKQISR